MIFVGDQERDALAWPGLQEPEVPAVGQCSWLPAPQPGQHRSRSLCWAQARAPAVSTWPTRCGRSLELKPWLCPHSGPSWKQHSISEATSFLRAAGGSATSYAPTKVQLWLQLPKLQTHAISPEVMTVNCPPPSLN